MNKRLYRSRTESTIGGVCGGLGEYFGIDPTFLRIMFVLLIFADLIGVLAYLIAWIVIPREPYVAAANTDQGLSTAAGEPGGVNSAQPAQVETANAEKIEYASWNKYIPGAILVVLGVFFILREHYWWWNIGSYWPLLLIVIGVFLVLRVGNGHRKMEEGSNESGKI